MIRRPPRSTLCPYTTRSRSAPDELVVAELVRGLEVVEVPTSIVKTQTTRTAGGRSAPGAPVELSIVIPTLDATSDRVRACVRSEEHTSELQSRQYLVCRLLL